MGFYLVMIGIVVALGLVLWARSVPRSRDLGVGPTGELAACPSRPNCVSSQATRESQAMEPWPYTSTTEQARSHLLMILRLLPNVEIVADEELYIAAEFRVAQVFMDDVEFLIDPQQRVVQFRSASRLGHSDLGVNRKRMQRIGDAFRAAQDAEKDLPPESTPPSGEDEMSL